MPKWFIACIRLIAGEARLLAVESFDRGLVDTVEALTSILELPKGSN